MIHTRVSFNYGSTSNGQSAVRSWVEHSFRRRRILIHRYDRHASCGGKSGFPRGADLHLSKLARINTLHRFGYSIFVGINYYDNSSSVLPVPGPKQRLHHEIANQNFYHRCHGGWRYSGAGQRLEHVLYQSDHAGLAFRSQLRTCSDARQHYFLYYLVVPRVPRCFGLR